MRNHSSVLVRKSEIENWLWTMKRVQIKMLLDNSLAKLMWNHTMRIWNQLLKEFLLTFVTKINQVCQRKSFIKRRKFNQLQLSLFKNQLKKMISLMSKNLLTRPSSIKKFLNLNKRIPFWNLVKSLKDLHQIMLKPWPTRSLIRWRQKMNTKIISKILRTRKNKQLLSFSNSRKKPKLTMPITKKNLMLSGINSVWILRKLISTKHKPCGPNSIKTELILNP